MGGSEHPITEGHPSSNYTIMWWGVVGLLEIGLKVPSRLSLGWKETVKPSGVA